MSLPDVSVSRTDMAAVRGRLRSYQARYAPFFGRRELRGHARAYLQGLLSDEPRKSFERMVLRRRGADANTVRTRQLFLCQARCDDTPILAAHRELVASTLGEAEGGRRVTCTVAASRFSKVCVLLLSVQSAPSSPRQSSRWRRRALLISHRGGSPDLLPVSMRPGQPIGESVNDGHQVRDQLSLWK